MFGQRAAFGRPLSGITMNKHFLKRLGEFFHANKAQMSDMTSEEIAKMLRDARAHSGGKQKAENRMSMSESFARDGEWRLFMEQQFAEPPATIQVLPKPGVYSHPRYGKFTMTPEMIQKFVDNHNQHVYQEQIPIDVEHQSKLSGAVGYFGEMRLIDGGKGGAEADVNWNERGKQLIQNDAFKYFSPEWFDEWADPTTSNKHANVLVGGAITTRPFFKDKVLRPLVASEDAYYTFKPEEADGKLTGFAEDQEPFKFDEQLEVTLEVSEDSDILAILQLLTKFMQSDIAEDAQPLAVAMRELFSDPDSADVHINSLLDVMKKKKMMTEEPFQYSDDPVLFRDFSPEQRKSYAKSGVAMPDGSYPIPDRDALHRAVQAYGRSPDEATKNHIKSRARALGLTSMLPEEWNPGGKKAAMEDIDEKTKEFVEAETKQLTERLEASEGARKAAEERLVKLENEAQTRRFTDIIMGRDAGGDGSPPFPGKHETHHKTLSVLAKEFGEDSAEFKEYVEEQRAVAKQMREAGMFKEKGIGSGPTQIGGTSAVKAFNEAVDAWMTANPGKMRGEAIEAVSKAKPKLYTEYIKENNDKAKKASTRYGYENDEEDED